MGVRNQLVSVSELNGSEDFSKRIIQTVSVASPPLPELSNGSFVFLLLASAGSHSGLQEKSFKKKKIALDNLKIKSPVEHLWIWKETCLNAHSSQSGSYLCWHTCCLHMPNTCLLGTRTQ